MSKFKVLLQLFLFLCLSNSVYAWNEVECSSIKKQAFIEHSYYTPQYCWESPGGAQSPHSFVIQFYDGNHFIDYMTQTIVANNTIWGNDYAYQNLKKENMEEEFQRLNLGTNPSISSKTENILSSDNKIRMYYKTFETSDGKGIYGGNTMDKTFYTFLFFTEDKSEIINDDFLSEILSSFTIKGRHSGKLTSVSISSGNLKTSNSSSSQIINNKSINDTSDSDAFIQMCKNSTLSDLDKDVAMLCLEKM